MHRAAALFAALLASFCVSARTAAQDMPWLRKVLERELIEELSGHNSQDAAWYHEKSIDRKKWTSGKLLGRKIRLASWTEHSKTWFWLIDPANTLHVSLSKLAVRDARIEFAIAANAKAGFRVWGRIPKLVQGNVGGTALIQFEIEGSTAVGGGGLTDSRVVKFQGRLVDLRFHNDLAHPFEDLVKDALNDYVQDKNDKLRQSIEKAVDRVHF